MKQVQGEDLLIRAMDVLSVILNEGPSEETRQETIELIGEWRGANGFIVWKGDS